MLHKNKQILAKETKNLKNNKKFIDFYLKICYYSKAKKIWSHGQAVKTPPSHGGIRGSIPLGTTNRNFVEPIILRRFSDWRLATTAFFYATSTASFYKILPFGFGCGIILVKVNEIKNFKCNHKVKLLLRSKNAKTNSLTFFFLYNKFFLFFVDFH